MKRTLVFSTASLIALSGVAAATQDTSIRREHGVGREDPDYLAEGSTAPEEGDRVTIDTEQMSDEPVIAPAYGDMDGVQDGADTTPGPKPVSQQSVEVIEWNEMFETRLHQAFHAIDADDDAMISRQEWGNWQADDGFYAARFGEFDRDGDGSVAWSEYWTATSALYDVSGLTTSDATG